MKSGRLEAFSDGVLAIVITIMVLEMKAPEAATFDGLLPVLPLFISYLLSFVYIGIYWNNHHHLFQVTERVNGKILWANLHLLFWLSLIPFTTSWIGENHLEPMPVALYGSILLMSATAYRILEICLLQRHHPDNPMHSVIKPGLKESVSMLIYLAAIPLAFVSVWISLSLYITVAVLWLIPSRTLEQQPLK